MKTSLAKFLKIALPLGLGALIIYYSYSKFSSEQIEEIKFYFQEADYGIVLLSVLFSAISHFSRAYRWNFMLEPLGYRPRLANNFMAISIAYIMNIPLPKSGEISRGIIMDKYEGIPFEKGFGTIISERVVDLIFLLGFTLAAFLLQFDLLYGYVSTYIAPQKLLLLGIGGFVLGILFLLFLKYPIIPGVGKKFQQKILDFLNGLKEGVFSIIKMKKKGAFMLHTCFIWGMYLLSFYTATHALEATSAIGMSALITTFVVGGFSFAFSNSGFGFYPFFVAGILTLFAIPQTIGTAFGWIVWTSNIASIIFFGGLSFLLLPFYNRTRKV